MTTFEELINQSLPQNYSNSHRLKIKNNIEQLANELGIKPGRAMTIKEADQQSCNPLFGEEDGYGINCQTCAPTYLMRLRGLNVTAGELKENNLSDLLARFEHKKGGKIIYHCWDCYSNVDETEVIPTLFHDEKIKMGINSLSSDIYKEILENNTQDQGAYQIAFKYKSKLGGGHHVLIVQRCLNEKLYYLDPQEYDGKNVLMPIDDLVTQMDTKGFGGILRIDDKIIKKEYAGIFRK